MKNKALKRLIYVQRKMLSICLILFLTTPLYVFASSVRDTVVNTGYKLKTVIVDAGHGANPKGPGKFSYGTSGFYSLERDVTLSVSKKLQKAIEKEINGVNAVLTRET